MPGNELVDMAAKQATSLSGPGRSISLACSQLLAKKSVPDPPLTHARSSLVYSKRSSKKEAEVTTRKDQVNLARIRSGHHLMFGETRNRYNPEEDPSCPRCGHPLEDMSHWLLECPGTSAAKYAIFGASSVELAVLSEFPNESKELARRTLRGSEHHA